MTRPVKHAEVIIVGAGVAGLSAANRLLEHGTKEVMILEATDRLGGRVNTVDFGYTASGTKSLVELGANWIHGEQGNPIHDLALKRGLLNPFVLLDRMKGYCYTEDGRKLDRDLTEKVWAYLQEVELQPCDPEYINQHKELKNLKDYFNIRMEEKFLLLPKVNRDDARSIFNCMLNYLTFHFGTNLESVSVRCAEEGEDFPGGNVKIPGGFLKVLQLFTERFTSDTVQYNTEVVKIIWNQDNGKSQVCCVQNNTEHTYTCDVVIVTCSLGVLKATHSTLFEPQLPVEKISAIRNMGYGQVNKIFLYYKKPFWKEGEGSVKLALSELNNQFSSGESWWRSIFCFDEVLNNPGVLVAWIGGVDAKHIEGLPDDIVTSTCTTVLRKFLNNDHIPEPDEMIRSTWCGNKYFRGSYSYVSVEETVDKDRAALCEPLINSSGKLDVLFAGEATHSWYGTTHGAMQSGQREADRIIKKKSDYQI